MWRRCSIYEDNGRHRRAVQVMERSGHNSLNGGTRLHVHLHHISECKILTWLGASIRGWSFAAFLEAKKEGFSHDGVSVFEETRNFGCLWKVTTTSSLECGNTEEESSTAVSPLAGCEVFVTVGFIRWVLYPILREASFQTNKPLLIRLTPGSYSNNAIGGFFDLTSLKELGFFIPSFIGPFTRTKPPKLWRSRWVDACGCSSTQ